MTQTLDEQLFDAAESLDVAAVERLLKAGANANARRVVKGSFRSEEQSPLGFAQEASRHRETPECLQVFSLLLDHGADPDFGIRDSLGNTPLGRASWAGHSGKLKLLLDHGAHVRYSDLKAAAERDHLEAVQVLVGHSRDLLSPEDESPLIACCEAYRCRDKDKRDQPIGLETARHLLDAGVDPNRHEPLTSAIQGGFLELADLLVQRGARLESSELPLTHYAKDVRTLRWLATRGVDLNARDADGDTALSRCLSDNLDIVRFLLDANADVGNLTDAHPSTGENRLMHPARAGAAAALELVLPLVKLSEEDGRKLLAEAEDPKTKAVIAKHIGLKVKAPTKLRLGELISESGKGQWSRIAASLDRIEKQLRKNSPELWKQLQAHFAEAESLELVESLRDDLKKCARLWSSENRNPLEAVVFEWAGRVTSPYDAGALAAGYASCKLEGDSAALRKALFVDRGDLSFTALLREPDGLSDADDEVQDAVAQYFAHKAAAMLNLAAGLVGRDDGFAGVATGDSLALFVREHDQDPVLAYVHRASERGKKAKPSSKPKRVATKRRTDR